MKIHRFTLSAIFGWAFLAYSILSAPWPKPHPMLGGATHGAQVASMAAEGGKAGKGVGGVFDGAQAARNAVEGMHGVNGVPDSTLTAGKADPKALIDGFRGEGSVPETPKGFEPPKAHEPEPHEPPEPPHGKGPEEIDAPKGPTDPSAEAAKKPPSRLKVAGKAVLTRALTPLGWLSKGLGWVGGKWNKFKVFLGTKLLHGTDEGRKLLPTELVGKLDAKAELPTRLQKVYNVAKVSPKAHMSKFQNHAAFWNVPWKKTRLYSWIQQAKARLGMKVAEEGKEASAGAKEASAGAKEASAGAKEASAGAKAAKPPSRLKLAAGAVLTPVLMPLAWLSQGLGWVGGKWNKFKVFLGTKLLHGTDEGRKLLPTELVGKLDAKAELPTRLQKVYNVAKVSPKAHMSKFQNHAAFWKVPWKKTRLYSWIQKNKARLGMKVAEEGKEGSAGAKAADSAATHGAEDSKLINSGASHAKPEEVTPNPHEKPKDTPDPKTHPESAE
ncbi:hypothetical protein PtA15_11A459 [Puccinia triticina]|uniref:Uncharacterized protein n=1 Tax=Puccinia triticina TaxID=208348 RepID=A0ABY7CWU2_9BASI|nr:uncharacterized protein PtA15_11A459 [Puccinia triticina]WAQ89768.1 hypothetical protein PtA15_11A459 [Puccinia triticina]